MSKNHAVVVLDMTGSMGGQEQRVVSSLNEYVEQLPAKCRLTVFLFNSQEWIRQFSGKVKHWIPMEAKDYKPAHLTPLFDSIAKGILHAEQTAEQDDKVFIMVDTDGLENFSREYDHAHCKAMVKSAQDRGWQVHFMAAGIDTAQVRSVGMTGQSLGTQTHDTLHSDRKMVYRTAGATAADYFDPNRQDSGKEDGSTKRT